MRQAPSLDPPLCCPVGALGASLKLSSALLSSSHNFSQIGTPYHKCHMMGNNSAAVGFKCSRSDSFSNGVEINTEVSCNGAMAILVADGGPAMMHQGGCCCVSVIEGSRSSTVSSHQH